MGEIILIKDRERAVKRFHPWIFSGAVAAIKGSPKLGETVHVLSTNGEFLAKAAYNPNSNIIGRIWTWDINEQIDQEFLTQKIVNAIEARRHHRHLINSDSMRIVYGESDGIPGLVLDQYNDICVAQFLSAGVEFWKNDLVDIIIKGTGAKCLYERSDVDVRKLEGLLPREGVLYGHLEHEKIEIIENDIRYYVDIVSGHKTGFYLDQRENRFYARNFSQGLDVLDCFSYTGGFAINTLMGGANNVTLVDSSEAAVLAAKDNIITNKLPINKATFVEQDVFSYLRFLRDAGKSFDMIILDPPKFAPTAAQTERASRAYKDINLLSLKLLKRGGYLFTFSCSGGVSEDLFQKIVSGAALDAGVNAQIIQRLHQSIDHPVSLNFPEGAYLKGFVIRKTA